MVRAEDDGMRASLTDVRSVVPEPMWDFTVFCRFLAGRLPDRGAVSAGELGKLAEELIEDLAAGRDRRRNEPSRTPLLDDRGEIVYQYFRRQLVEAVRAMSGDAFADALRKALRQPGMPVARTGAGVEVE